MRNLLAILMPKHQDVHFTLAQCLFLLTVYHSEMFEGMRYGRIFRYVLNMPRSEMTWAVSALVNKVWVV